MQRAGHHGKGTCRPSQRPPVKIRSEPRLHTGLSGILAALEGGLDRPGNGVGLSLLASTLHPACKSRARRNNRLWASGQARVVVPLPCDVQQLVHLSTGRRKVGKWLTCRYP